MSEIIPHEGPNHPTMLRPLVRPDELINAHKEVADLIAKGLQQNVDYGVIPGTQKASLLKPGAERLLKAFGCTTKYLLVDKNTDHNEVVKWTKEKKIYRDGRFSHKEPVNGESHGVYRYVYKAQVVKNLGGCPKCGTEQEMLIGESDGSCSTLESKYIDRPRDSENTVVKMAQKRAMVAAVLNAFGLSDRFTQDVEDLKPDEPEYRGDELQKLGLRVLMQPYNVSVNIQRKFHDALLGTPISNIKNAVSALADKFKDEIEKEQQSKSEGVDDVHK